MPCASRSSGCTVWNCIGLCESTRASSGAGGAATAGTVAQICAPQKRVPKLSPHRSRFELAHVAVAEREHVRRVRQQLRKRWRGRATHVSRNTEGQTRQGGRRCCRPGPRRPGRQPTTQRAPGGASRRSLAPTQRALTRAPPQQPQRAARRAARRPRSAPCGAAAARCCGARAQPVAHGYGMAAWGAGGSCVNPGCSRLFHNKIFLRAYPSAYPRGGGAYR